MFLFLYISLQIKQAHKIFAVFLEPENMVVSFAESYLVLQAEKLKEAESLIQSLKSCSESLEKEKEGMEMVLMNLISD
jgi:hypothetical protein